MSDLLRVYETVGKDGYPAEWHATIKHLVREQAGLRCVRCRHPYRNGEHGSGEWTPCDATCSHVDGNGNTHALWRPGEGGGAYRPEPDEDVSEWRARMLRRGLVVESAWRILTVHHLNGNKADCRWWNLAALCQRCHLTIQGRVQLHRVYPWEHSEWFKPYAAGWYAHAYLGEELTREETAERIDDLLALERSA